MVLSPPSPMNRTSDSCARTACTASAAEKNHHSSEHQKVSSGRHIVLLLRSHGLHLVGSRVPGLQTNSGNRPTRQFERSGGAEVRPVIARTGTCRFAPTGTSQNNAPLAERQPQEIQRNFIFRRGVPRVPRTIWPLRPASPKPHTAALGARVPR